MKFIDRINFDLDIYEILKLLQKPKKSKPPSQELVAQINEFIEKYKDLIKPTAIYDIFPSNKLKPSHVFNLSEITILAICTISNKLEDEITLLLRKGEFSKGVILDAIASHATEIVAEKVNEEIINDNKPIFEGKKFTKRFSPGYCRWTIEDGQKVIFDLLPAEKIGIKLSDSMMMIPRKSISFAINVGEIIDENLGISECETCTLENCSYRRF